MCTDLISIIIPAYNHEQYIEEAIQSVIAQTYQHLELIIVNDGSSDATFEKINAMKALCEDRFVRVVLETQENKGTCQTFNRLLTLAQGEYVFLLASDDKIFPNALETLHDFLSKNDEYALAVGDNLIMDDKSVLCYWDKKRNNVYDETQASWASFSDYVEQCTNINFDSASFGEYEALLRDNHIVNGYLIRTSIFDKVGYFTPEAPLEDYWLMLQIAKHAKMKYIRQPFFAYRWHATNTAKQVGKMRAYTNKTLLAEKHATALLEDTTFHTKFTTFFEKKDTKILLKLFSTFILYKCKTDYTKELRLQLGSKKITLWTRKIDM